MSRRDLHSRGALGMALADKAGTGNQGRWGRSRWPVTAAAILLLAVVVGLGTGKLPVSASSAVKYRLATVDSGPMISAISTAGIIKPLAAILVGSQVSGQIKELAADFNSRVTGGNVIARLNDDAIQARLAHALIEVDVASAAVSVQRAQLERAGADADVARAAVVVAQAEVERAEMTLKDAERERDRKRELFSRGVSSIAERDRAEVAFDSGQTQLTAARARQLAAVSAQTGSQAAIRIAAAQLEHALAQVTLREAVVRQVRVELEHTVIRTPIDGIVIERNIDIGQTVAASLQAPTLFTIAPDLRAMQVHANVDEADIGRVLSGQEVSFAVDSFPGRSFQGRVVDIRKMPQSTQNVVAYTVVISADNDDLLLLPGMTANARILVQERDDVLRVPNAAIRFRPAGKPKLAISNGARELPPERLLRSALDSIGLPIGLRREIDLVVEKAGCAAREGENESPRSNGRDMAMLKACREASNRVIEILSDEERGRYQEARSLLARDAGTTAAEVWVVGPAGTPEARRVLLGVTDGLMTEIAGGDLRKGERVIVGAEADLPRSAGLAGF